MYNIHFYEWNSPNYDSCLLQMVEINGGKKIKFCTRVAILITRGSSNRGRGV